MAVRAGDIVAEHGPFECIECGGRIQLERGDEVPVCPCGGFFYLETGPLPARESDTHTEHHRRWAA